MFLFFKLSWHRLPCSLLGYSKELNFLSLELLAIMNLCPSSSDCCLCDCSNLYYLFKAMTALLVEWSEY